MNTGVVQSRTSKTGNPPGKQINGPELFPERISLNLDHSFVFLEGFLIWVSWTVSFM